MSEKCSRRRTEAGACSNLRRIPASARRRLRAFRISQTRSEESSLRIDLRGDVGDSFDRRDFHQRVTPMGPTAGGGYAVRHSLPAKPRRRPGSGAGSFLHVGSFSLL